MLFLSKLDDVLVFLLLTLNIFEQLTLNKQILAGMLSTLTDLSTTSISLNFECFNVLND